MVAVESLFEVCAKVEVDVCGEGKVSWQTPSNVLGSVWHTEQAGLHMPITLRALSGRVISVIGSAEMPESYAR